jgi:hypothetical protein
MIHRPKNYPGMETQTSSSKGLAYVFWGKDGILLVENLRKGTTMRAKYYVAFLDKLKQQLSPHVEASFRKESCFS